MVPVVRPRRPPTGATHQTPVFLRIEGRRPTLARLNAAGRRTESGRLQGRRRTVLDAGQVMPFVADPARARLSLAYTDATFCRWQKALHERE